MVMMQGGMAPQGMATGPDHGKGVGQGGPLDGMQDGKGSRVAGLSRNSQPKQGANWRDTQAAPRNARGGRPGLNDFQNSFAQPDMNMMQQGMQGLPPDMQQLGNLAMMAGTMPGANPMHAMGMMPGSPAKSGAPM